MNPNFIPVAIGTLLFVAPPQVQTPPVPPTPPAAPSDMSRPVPTSTLLSVAVSHRLPDGSRGAMAAADIVDGGTRQVWTDAALCSVGTAADATLRPGAITWRVTAKVMERSADAYVVRFDWARLPDGTVVTDAPSASQTATLRAGQPVLLDRLEINGRCGSGEVRLEGMLGAYFSLRPTTMVTPTVGGRGGVGVPTTAGRAGGGTGGARSGGGGANVSVPGATPPPRGGGRGGGGAAGVATGVPIIRSGRGATPAGGVGDILGSVPADRVQLVVPSSPIAADLWLVHRRPDGTEQTELQSIQVGEKFAFKPVTVVTTRGPVVIDVSGTLLQRLENNVPDGYGFNINRRIRSEGQPPLEVNGGSLVHVRPTASGEVVAIPIPEPARGRVETTISMPAGAARGGRGGAVAVLPETIDARGGAAAGSQAEVEAAQLLRGHRFEVRLRIK